MVDMGAQWRTNLRWLQFSEAERQKYLSPMTIVAYREILLIDLGELFINVIQPVKFLKWPILPAIKKRDQ